MRFGKSVTLLSLAAAVLLASEVSLDSVVVESSTIEDLLEDPKTEVSTVNVIDEQKIEIVDPKNLGDVLRTIPGITADVRSGDVVEIHIRGVNQQEFMWEDTGVAVVIDGVPVLQNGGKVKFNLDEIESIKVIKGGASYLYGPNAMAGAIIITTKKPKNKNVVDLKAEVGDYDYQNYRASIYRSTGKWMGNLVGAYRYTSGYWDMSENWTKSGSGKLTYFIDDMSDITLGIDITRKYEESSRGSVTGVTAAETNPTGEDDADLPWNHDYYSDIDKYFLTYSKDFERGANLMANVYYYMDKYDYEASPQDLNGDGIEDTYTRDSNEDIYQKGFKTEYRDTFGSFAYMVGADIGQRELEAFDITKVTYSSRRGDYYAGEWSAEDGTEDRYGLYTEIKYRFSPKTIYTINGRYDYEKYDYEETDYDFDGTAWNLTSASHEKGFRNFSWRFGIAHDVTAADTLYASVSTGFRNPRVYEIFAADFDPDRYSQNNYDLKPQRTINYEIGIRGHREVPKTTLHYNASAFLLKNKSIIARTGGTYYSSGSNIYFDNVGEAWHKGVEVSAGSDRSKRVAFELAYTYLIAYYKDHLPVTVDLAPLYRPDGDMTYDVSGNYLPRVPRHKVDLFLYIDLTHGWKFIPEWYRQSSYYADETNLVKMPGYSIINAQLRYNGKIKGNDFEFFVKVDNVTDNQYYRTVYLFSDRNNDGVLDAEDASITVDPGRVWYVGVKYRF
jgi:iron complex outermembrane receptor protein